MKTNRSTSARRSFVCHWKLLSRFAAVVRAFVTTVLVLVGVVSSSASERLNALVATTVKVPLARRYFPFEHDRVGMVPPGFNISVVAQIPLARFIMPLSTGEILVAQPSSGSILLVRPQANGTAAVLSLIEDLHNPQEMVLHSENARLYLYVGESNRVSRFLIAPGGASATEKTVIVPNLPDSSSSELRGACRHELKSLAIGPDNKLYVDVASSTNADPKDTTANPVRSAIYQYDLDGADGRIFARGIRNAEGLAFIPRYE
jgi:glucose/arabinose dehydrogenase